MIQIGTGGRRGFSFPPFRLPEPKGFGGRGSFALLVGSGGNSRGSVISILQAGHLAVVISSITITVA